MECTQCKMQEEIIVSRKVSRSDICNRGDKLYFVLRNCTGGAWRGMF